MANPSTTGTGTEVIRRFYYDATGGTERRIITVPANHIYIVKSIFFTEKSNQADAIFSLYVDYDGGGTDVYLLEQQPNPNRSTFILNDVFVLSAGDILNFICDAPTSGSGEDHDIYGTFIDQDWS